MLWLFLRGEDLSGCTFCEGELQSFSIAIFFLKDLYFNFRRSGEELRHRCNPFRRLSEINEMWSQSKWLMFRKFFLKRQRWKTGFGNNSPPMSKWWHSCFWIHVVHCPCPTSQNTNISALGSREQKIKITKSSGGGNFTKSFSGVISPRPAKRKTEASKCITHSKPRSSHSSICLRGIVPLVSNWKRKS